MKFFSGVRDYQQYKITSKFFMDIATVIRLVVVVLAIAAGDVDAQSSNRVSATATTSAPDSVQSLTASEAITTFNTDGMTVVSTAADRLSPTDSSNFPSLTASTGNIPCRLSRIRNRWAVFD